MKFAFDSVPEPTHRKQVCDGIEWFRMPLPFALNHVNCWLLGDQTLVDTGVNNQATRDYWQAAFDQSTNWPGELLVTHFHPDHMGLASWFEQHGTRQLLGSEVEITLACDIWAVDDADYAAGYADWYVANGLPETVVAVVRQAGNTYRSKAAQPPALSQWDRLRSGQHLKIGDHDYTVMIGRGHAPDMIMLYRESDHVLIAADQVLPSISPNVSVMPRLTDGNPLKSFLESLDSLRRLPEDTLVLPSHGVPFYGLHARLEDLAAHHELRLSQVLDACKQPRSSYEMFSVLFGRELDAQQTAFALGESLAHLHYLEVSGKLEAITELGVRKFQQR